MAIVNFYHLNTINIYLALAKLLDKALSQEQKILVRTDSTRVAEEIDEFLWSYDLPSFIPHSKVGDKNFKMSPIYITDEKNNPNNAEILFIISTPKLSLEEILTFKRTFILFSNNDLEILNLIERFWLELENPEVKRSYWVQEKKRMGTEVLQLKVLTFLGSLFFD